jgi:hypothetical protein
VRKASWALLIFLAGCEGCGCGSEVESLVAVAKCAEADGDVRRRPSTSSAWNSLGVGDALFAGDWVQTALSAAARVDFSSGDQLRVAPGTTVVIEDPGVARRQRVSVKSGRVEGELIAAGELVVEGPDGSPVTLRAKDRSRYRLEVESGGGVAVSVSQGEVALSTPEGTTAVKGGEAQVIKGGKAVGAVEKLLASPEVPALPVRTIGEAAPITARPVVGAKKYICEIAKDEGFTSGVIRLESDDPSFDFTPSGPGEYWVRVSASSDTGRESVPSAPEKLVIRSAPPEDRLLEPKAGTAIATDEPEAKVELSWKAPPEGGPYVVVVAKEGAIDRDVVSETEVGAEKATIKLPLGRYVWGVYKKNGRTPLFPSARSLVVVKANRELRVPKKIPWK